MTDKENQVKAKPEGNLCMYESLAGVVSKVIGDQIQVTFETPDGPLKQIYSKDQFLHSKAPEEGESVEARVFMSAVPRKKRDEEPKEIRPDFRTTHHSPGIIID